MDGFIPLAPNDLTTIAGMAKLNNMLQTLFNNAVGDAVQIADYNGYGTPNGTLAANIGSTYRQIDGTATTSFWVKTTDNSNTGWIALSAALTVPVSVANGGTGADFSGATAGNLFIFTATGVLGLTTFPAHGAFFSSSGTFVAPTGVTQVYITAIAAGASGTVSGQSPGGGAGEFIINKPYVVIPGNSYTVTINAGGAAVTSGVGNDGGTTVFDAITLSGGKHGSGANGGAGGGTGYSANAVTTVSTSPADAAFSGGNGFSGQAANFGGAGGSSPFGQGGAGAVNGTAGSGTGYGSGGGGATGIPSTTGAGASGFVLVAW